MSNGEKPAFTILDPNGSYYEPGLTKREYFAAMALQGILANPAHNSNDIMGVNGSIDLGFIAVNFAAREAVAYADELLKALE